MGERGGGGGQGGASGYSSYCFPSCVVCVRGGVQEEGQGKGQGRGRGGPLVTATTASQVVVLICVKMSATTKQV